jgi:hypothetical protein
MQPLARVTAAPVAERCGGLAPPGVDFTLGAFQILAIYEIDGYPRPLAGVFPSARIIKSPRPARRRLGHVGKRRARLVHVALGTGGPPARTSVTLLRVQLDKRAGLGAGRDERDLDAACSARWGSRRRVPAEGSRAGGERMFLTSEGHNPTALARRPGWAHPRLTL